MREQKRNVATIIHFDADSDTKLDLAAVYTKLNRSKIVRMLIERHLDDFVASERVVPIE